MKRKTVLQCYSFLLALLMASSFYTQLPAQTTPVDTTSSQQVHYQFVEKPAEFPGGEIAMREYIVKNLKYPEEAREQMIEGIVYIEFVIEIDGEVTNVSVLQGTHPLLDQAAVKIVEAMPLWIPGEQRGRKVRSMFILPVQYQLSKEDKKSVNKNESRKTSAIISSISLAIGSVIGLILLLR